MTVSTELSPSPLDERDLYPIHEEDNVPETDLHERLVRYLRDALDHYFSDRYVGGNICVYWERGNTRRYVAPDVFVAQGTLATPHPRTYLLWKDPPVIFAAEISSRATQSQDEGPKLEIFRQHLHVPECLHLDADHQELQLWRLGPEGYEQVPPEATGRVRSQELDLEFELDQNGFLWVYTLEGERLHTYEEAERLLEEEMRQRQEAEAQAAEEARQRTAEAQRRLEAEARAQAAELRAAEEAARREELERQLAELQAQIERQEP